MEAQLQRARVGGAVAVAHPAGPDAAGGAVLADLLEEVDVGVEEEAEAGREVVDGEAGGHGGLDVGEAVGQGEGQLLGGRRAGLADVVAGDRHRVPPRHLGGGEPDDVGDQPHATAGAGRCTPSGPGTPSGCRSAGCRRGGRARRRSPRRRRRTWPADMAAGELMVIDVVTSPRSMPANRSSMSASVSTATPALPTSPRQCGVVGVATHQGGQVEGGRQAVAARAQDLLEAGVGVLRRCRSRRTCASSRASSGTSRRTGPACRATGPETRRRRARTPASTGTPDMVSASTSRLGADS